MIRFFIIMVLVVVGDQLSKLWILENYALYESTAVIPGFFNLTFLRNSGAAFGMLSEMPLQWRQIFFISIAVVALVALIVMQRKMGRENIWYTLGFALIGGGAVGNVIDRVRDGSVVDFLDFYVGKYHWPAFNVADSGIMVGVTIFFLLQIFEKEGKARGEAGMTHQDSPRAFNRLIIEPVVKGSLLALLADWDATDDILAKIDDPPVTPEDIF